MTKGIALHDVLRGPSTVLVVLLLCAAGLARPAVASAPDGDVGASGGPVVVGTATPDPLDTPTPTPSATPTPTATADATPDPAPDGDDPVDETPVPVGGPNNAALQTDEVKREEAETSCRETASRLLATGGSASLDRDDSWVWLPFLVAAVCAALVAAGYAVRRYRALRRTEASSPPSLLEVVATLVAICAGVTGLAAQFIPGFGPEEKPPRKAEMSVRSINARITNGEFLRRADGAQAGSGIDQREIGNVVWLQLYLSGYGGEDLRLQWGSYEADGGRALVAATTHQEPIAVSDDSDELTLFEPVWVGYPGLERFQVHFRLLTQDGEVQELTTTAPMRGDRSRYLCAPQ